MADEEKEAPEDQGTPAPERKLEVRLVRLHAQKISNLERPIRLVGLKAKDQGALIQAICHVCGIKMTIEIPPHVEIPFMRIECPRCAYT